MNDTLDMSDTKDTNNTIQDEHKYKTLSLLVDRFLETYDSWFESEKIWRYIGIDYDDREAKHIISNILCYKVRSGELEGSRGRYRQRNTELDILEWRGGNPNNRFQDLKFPFRLEDYVVIYPRNIMILAGSKDAGKTGYAFNFISLNMFDYDIFYFSSELGELEMEMRLRKFEKEGMIDLDSWRFTAVNRSTDFADVIQADAINIVDYLEIDKDFAEAGRHINEIYRRLNTGIAFIVMQKNFLSPLAIGGERTLEKARLYMTMNPGELTIVSGKNWKNEHLNPKGKKFKFKLVQGCKFIQE